MASGVTATTAFSTVTTRASITPTGTAILIPHASGAARNQTFSSLPSPTAGTSSSASHPRPQTSGLAVGIGISMGFAFLIVTMMLWHFFNTARRRRRQSRMMSRFNFGTDDLMKPGTGSKSHGSESAEVVEMKPEIMQSKGISEWLRDPRCPDTVVRPPQSHQKTARPQDGVVAQQNDQGPAPLQWQPISTQVVSDQRGSNEQALATFRNDETHGQWRN